VRPITTFAERLAKKRKELARAERAYYEACAHRDGGNSLDALDALTAAVLEVGRLEDAIRGPAGKFGATCDASATDEQLPLAAAEARRA
jgi:hypothetical protein